MMQLDLLQLVQIKVDKRTNYTLRSNIRLTSEETGSCLDLSFGVVVEAPNFKNSEKLYGNTYHQPWHPLLSPLMGWNTVRSMSYDTI